MVTMVEKNLSMVLANIDQLPISFKVALLQVRVFHYQLPFHVVVPPNKILTTARSLSTGHTSTRSSFIAPWKAHTSADAEDSVEEPLLAGSLPTKPAQPSKTKNLFCVVSALTFVFGTMNISSTENSRVGLVLQISNATVPEYVHRKLLQVNDKQPITSTSGGYGGIGTYMGWGMAAIYVGGWLP